MKGEKSFEKTYFTELAIVCPFVSGSCLCIYF